MKKKIILACLLACLAGTASHAQEVYRQIHDKAAAAAQATGESSLLQLFARFKLDALDYLAIRMKEQMPDSSAVLLDKKALALNQFISLYMQTLLEYRQQPPALQTKVMKVFTDATVNHPMFRDRDKELVHAYLQNPDSPTRFSLDTDWQLAFIAASNELKKIK